MVARQALVAFLTLVACSGPVSASPPQIHLVRHYFLNVEVLGVRDSGTVKLAAGTIEVSPGRPGKSIFPLDLFPAGEGQRLKEIEVRLEVAAAPGSALGIATVVRLLGPGDVVHEFRRERRAEAADGASFIHTAYQIPFGGGSVVVAFMVEARDEPELEPPRAGAPIVFRVFLVRVAEAGAVPVEENTLRTIEGASISYAFRRTFEGASSDGSGSPGPSLSDALELTLVPTRASDGILLVEAIITARIGADAPGSDGAVVMRRTQAVSNGGSFELTVEAPASSPGGSYRFVVRSQF